MAPLLTKVANGPGPTLALCAFGGVMYGGSNTGQLYRFNGIAWVTVIAVGPWVGTRNSKLISAGGFLYLVVNSSFAVDPTTAVFVFDGVSAWTNLNLVLTYPAYYPDDACAHGGELHIIIRDSLVTQNIQIVKWSGAAFAVVVAPFLLSTPLPQSTKYIASHAGSLFVAMAEVVTAINYGGALYEVVTGALVQRAPHCCNFTTERSMAETCLLSVNGDLYFQNVDSAVSAKNSFFFFRWDGVSAWIGSEVYASGRSYAKACDYGGGMWMTVNDSNAQRINPMNGGTFAVPNFFITGTSFLVLANHSFQLSYSVNRNTGDLYEIAEPRTPGGFFPGVL